MKKTTLFFAFMLCVACSTLVPIISMAQSSLNEIKLTGDDVPKLVQRMKATVEKAISIDGEPSYILIE